MPKKRPEIKPEEAAGLFKRTGPEPIPGQAEQPPDPVKAVGVALRESEWARFTEIAGELSMTRHELACWALREWLRRWEAGEIRTETKKTLPGI
jgi:hypothetical protein